MDGGAGSKLDGHGAADGWVYFIGAFDVDRLAG
jgi:hypothetical protein